MMWWEAQEHGLMIQYSEMRGDDCVNVLEIMLVTVLVYAVTAYFLSRSLGRNHKSNDIHVQAKLRLTGNYMDLQK